MMLDTLLEHRQERTPVNKPLTYHHQYIDSK